MFRYVWFYYYSLVRYSALFLCEFVVFAVMFFSFGVWLGILFLIALLIGFSFLLWVVYCLGSVGWIGGLLFVG